MRPRLTSAPLCGNSHQTLAAILLLPISLLASLLAWAAGGETAPAQPSVILISIDTLRADHLSCYGYKKIRTPHLDSFAQGGTLFVHAEAQVPLTLPSHMSLFTSTYPFQNGVEENGFRVPAGAVTLASVLRSNGYQTAAFIGSDFLDKRYRLDQGFDEYDSPFGIETQGIVNPLKSTVRRDGALVIRAARQWLYAHCPTPPGSAPPAFAFIHLFDVHTPYAIPADAARRRGISRYDAEIEYVDQLLGRFQEDLKRTGWWDKSLVVVFGDHGEGLGDHQETDHGYYIYESTLRVPLIVHWPAGSPAYAPVHRVPVGLIDVAPTILSYLRVPTPASFVGASQISALKVGESPRPYPVYSQSTYARDAFGWAPLRALRVGKYKYIKAPKAELYDLDADPREQVNLIRRNSAMAAELQSQLAKLLTRYAPAERATPSGLSPETLAQLESLGYLAAEPRGKNADSGSDPKDRFAEFQAYENAYIAFLEGHTAAAIPMFQAILRTDPNNTLARFHLGECYLQNNRGPAALQEWTTVLKLNPQYAPAAQAIGEYWLQQGDYAQARRRFQQVLALTPESYAGHFQLALAAEHLGLLDEARQHLEAACKIAPRDETCAQKLESLTPK